MISNGTIMGSAQHGIAMRAFLKPEDTVTVHGWAD
jgi:hypothetical protein